MQASLIVRDGKRQFTVELRKQETTIGRDPASDIILNDTACSRRHAVIVEAPDGKYLVRDLESRNGTLVNGVKVKEKPLDWGDRLSVGPLVILFVPRDEEDTGVDKKNATRAKSGIYRSKTMGVNVSDLDLTYVKKPKPYHVNSFYQIASVLPLYRDTERASEAMLDILNNNFRASRGAVLFFGAEEEPVIAHLVVRSSQEEYGTNIDFREDILKLVRSTARAFYQDDDYTALYCPIPHEGKAIGCLYLDTIQQSQKLTEDDLWVVSGIAIQYAVILQDLRYREKLEREKVALEESAAGEESLIGQSDAMKHVLSLVTRAAAGDDVAILNGENGTGKELVARSIHHASRRRAYPFVAVNCGGLDPSETEAALFGFQNADGARKGALERANGGTLFLDEVGQIDLLLQLKILKYLEERTFRRMGGDSDIPSDVRLILASTTPLKELVASKAFRDDLFQKLQGVDIFIPPLRERLDDMAILAEHFVKKYAFKIGKRLQGIEPEAVEALKKHSWPGNVRELQNHIEHAVMMAAGPKIALNDLPPL